MSPSFMTHNSCKSLFVNRLCKGQRSSSRLHKDKEPVRLNSGRRKPFVNISETLPPELPWWNEMTYTAHVKVINPYAAFLFCTDLWSAHTWLESWEASTFSNIKASLNCGVKLTGDSGLLLRAVMYPSVVSSFHPPWLNPVSTPPSFSLLCFLRPFPPKCETGCSNTSAEREQALKAQETSDTH